MARFFEGTRAQVALSNPGQAEIAFGTVAAVVRTDSDGLLRTILCLRDATVNRNLFTRDADNRIGWRCGGDSIPSTTLTYTISDGWAILAARKATGTTTPVLSKYVFTTNTWTHESGTGATPDVVTGTVITGFIASRDPDHQWKGDIAGLAIWPSYLTDQQLEALATGWDRWLDMPPRGFWILDQDSTSQKIRDLSGRGVDESSQTRTAVSTYSAPMGYGARAPVTFVEQGITLIGQVVETEAPLPMTAVETVPFGATLGLVVEFDNFPVSVPSLWGESPWGGGWSDAITGTIRPVETGIAHTEETGLFVDRREMPNTKNLAPRQLPKRRY